MVVLRNPGQSRYRPSLIFPVSEKPSWGPILNQKISEVVALIAIAKVADTAIINAQNEIRGGKIIPFLNQQHKFYCGIDPHARKMYVCILDQKGNTRVHQNLKTDPETLLDFIFPFLEDIMIGVECMFAWYWIADFCSEHKIPFVLDLALYRKIQ
jgi:hypothetical protein